MNFILTVHCIPHLRCEKTSSSFLYPTQINITQLFNTITEATGESRSWEAGSTSSSVENEYINIESRMGNFGQNIPFGF